MSLMRYIWSMGQSITFPNTMQVSQDPVEAEKMRLVEYEKYLRSPFSFIDKVHMCVCVCVCVQA